MLIAEELEVPLASVRVEHAPPGRALLRQSASGGPGDGQLERDPRRLGTDAARGGGGEDDARAGRSAALERRSGVVPRREGRRDPPGERSALGYGALVADASKLPVPKADSVALKRGSSSS